MKMSTLKSYEVWYVDSSASNHMMNHEEWFSQPKKLKQSRAVETGNNTSHPIKHIGDVPLSHVGQKGQLRNVLHVLMITKNLVSVDQSNHRPRNTSPVHSSRMLHRRRPDYRVRAPGREDVHPQDECHRHRNVCQGTKGWIVHWHVAQMDQ